MPKLPAYSYTGPVDHTVPVDKSKLRGKSIIVTGGANGLGEEFVRKFAAAGAFVTFGDVNQQRGREIESELNSGDETKVQFVQCDIRSWDAQIRLFDAAVTKSPAKSCDVVIANAGISRSSGDSLWQLDSMYPWWRSGISASVPSFPSPSVVSEANIHKIADPKEPATKPELNIIDVNINGTLFTFKLAMHYFRRQEDSEDRDRCFIMTGSTTTWIDSPGNWEYTCSKYALRGLMRTARRSTWQQGIRINYVAPSYVKSAIRSAHYEKYLTDKGVEFAFPEDVATAMMRLAGDRAINGHSLMIVPRSIAKEGYIDAGLDDFTEEGYMKSTQELQLSIIQDKWSEGEVVKGTV